MIAGPTGEISLQSVTDIVDGNGSQGDSGDYLSSLGAGTPPVWTPLPEPSIVLATTMEFGPVGETLTQFMDCTPEAEGLYRVLFYLRVVGASSTVALEVQYTDVSGPQTLVIIDGVTLDADSYAAAPMLIEFNGDVINFVASAVGDGQVYISGAVEGL